MAEDDKGQGQESSAEQKPAPSDEKKPSGGGGGAGALVILLSLAAAGAAGYFAWTEHAKGVEGQKELLAERAKSAKNTEIAEQLASCQKERDAHKVGRADTEKAAADAQASLTATRAELEELRRERAETEARLAAFKSIMTKFQKMIDTGKLKVLIRNGRMIVKLPAEIFFASGKAELTSEASPALKEIASILRQFPDRRFEVAGHTDNLPLHNENFKSNWSSPPRAR